MIETDDVVAITQNVFSTMIQMDAYPISMDACGAPETEMVGCIQIVGEWCGTVLLKSSIALASTAGSRMFSIDENEVADVERQDSLAELTNMIGGNIKSIVPGPSSLSLPTVTNGNDFQVRNFGSIPISDTAFQCDEHVFRVVILERDAASSMSV
jgi:chemotaxis protein CheX